LRRHDHCWWSGVFFQIAAVCCPARQMLFSKSLSSITGSERMLLPAESALRYSPARARLSAKSNVRISHHLFHFILQLMVSLQNCHKALMVHFCGCPTSQKLSCWDSASKSSS
jgi:aromatic ring hydroxylase